MSPKGPATKPVASAAHRDEARELVRQAVDLYDAVAHLEAHGLGNAAARRAGHANTFEHAEALFADVERERAGQRHTAPAPAQESGSRLTRLVRAAGHHLRYVARTTEPAFGRATVVLAGALICLGVMPAGSTDADFFLAGAMGWLAGQMVSAATWQGLGTGVRRTAVLNAALSSSGTVVAGGVAAAVTHQLTMFIWVLWAASSSIMSILGPRQRYVRGGAAAGALLVLLLTLASPAAAGPLKGSAIVVAVLSVLGLTIAAVILLRSEVGSGSRLVATPGMTRAMGLAIAQTAGQLVVLWSLLRQVGGEGFFSLAIAGLVAGIAADPILELAYARVGDIVAHPTPWSTGRRSTAVTGIIATTAIVLVGLGALGLAESVRPASVESGLAPAATVVVSALTAGCGLLLRAGSAGGAATMAMLTACGTVLAGLAGDSATIPSAAWLTILGVGTVIITSAVAASRLSHPSSW